METLKEFNENLTDEDLKDVKPAEPPKPPKLQKGEIWELDIGRYKVVSVKNKGKFLTLRRV